MRDAVEMGAIMSHGHADAPVQQEPETPKKNFWCTVWFLVLCVAAVIVAGVLPQALLG